MKKNNKLVRFLTRRQFRYGWYSILLTAILIAVIVGINVLVSAAETKWALKIDASPMGITKFTDQTNETLKALDQDIYVHLVFEKDFAGTARTEIEEVAGKFRAQSEHIVLDTIDPVTEPGRINEFKTATNNITMSTGAMIVTNKDKTRVKLVPASEMYSYQYDQNYNPITTSFNFESKLTQAILFVTSDSTPKVFFLSGHDEIGSSNCATVVQELQSNNYEVGDLTLTADTALEPTNCIVVNVPALDLSDTEYDQLKAFMDNGGRMMFVSSPDQDLSAIPNFMKLMDYYGIGYKDGVVVEDQASADNWTNSPMYLVPTMDAEHTITKNISGAKVVIPTPRAIQMPEMPLSGYSYSKLLTTSSAAFIKPLASQSDILTKDPGAEVGSQVLATAVLHQKSATDSTMDTRIVALGSPYLLVDAAMSISNNRQFALSAFDWMLDRQATTYVRTKGIADTQLAIPNQTVFLTWAAVVVIIVPALVLIAGIWISLRRRRL